VKLKIKGALFHCGRCRKSYSNPFGHVCITRLDRKAPAGKTKLAPKVTATAGKCGTCGKPRGLLHTCTVKTDFKQRRAAAKKAARPAHLYEACRDTDCQRPACRAFKEGRDEGREEGHREGYSSGHEDGYAEGYDRGFPDGVAACPRKHG
jgi:hypothetical protein